MTKLPLIAFAILAASGIAMPAFAASTVPSGNVPLCSPGSDRELASQKDALAAELHLSSKPNTSIDVWNGCLKVTTFDAGKTIMSFYDPDSLKLVAEV